MTNKKRTIEKFVEDAKRIHGDKYNYSDVVYVNSNTKVKILCPLHKVFLKTPAKHINSRQGCPDCTKEKRKITTKEFCLQANKVHNNFYGYKKVDYKNKSLKVTITCPEHGDFEQIPSNHLRGSGCPECGKGKLTSMKFCSQANKVHNNFYNYNKVNYVNFHSKVIITCPDHGDFKQSPGSHLRGSGCPECGRISSEKAKYLTIEKFIEKANEVHNNFYNYNKVDYKNSVTLVIITCPQHGEFSQRPDVHLFGSGCPECGKLSSTLLRSSSTNKFIEKANEVHNNFYNYNKVDYVNNHTKVTITCPHHGDFIQGPNKHLNGNGCQICGSELNNLGDTIFNLRKMGINRDGFLYVIECFNDKEHFYKIGITRHSLIDRFSGKMPYDYNVILCYPTDIIQAWEIEQNFIQYSDKNGFNYHPHIDFSGQTECFSVNPIDYDFKLKEIYEIIKYDEVDDSEF